MVDDPSRPTADETALSDARAGNTSALWRLAEEHRAYLKAVAARVLSPPVAAKVDPSDIVQRGLLAAFEALGQFRGADLDAWKAWLVAIVRNEARAAMQYWHQQNRDVGRERPMPEKSSVLVPLPADGSTPSEHAVERERAARLFQALERLPGEYAQVIRLRHFDGLSHRDVAQRMGRAEEAVRQLWVRALRRWRQEAGEES